jgi:hypothetical protein
MKQIHQNVQKINIQRIKWSFKYIKNKIVIYVKRSKNNTYKKSMTWIEWPDEKITLYFPLSLELNKNYQIHS